MNSTLNLSSDLALSDSYLFVISVILQLMLSNSFKSAIVAYDQRTTRWVDLLLQHANAENLQHDWVILNLANVWYSEKHRRLADRLLNPEHLLNIFFYDKETDLKFSSISQLISNDLRTYNIIVSDQPMERKRILRRFNVIYQQNYKPQNVAVLHVQHGRPMFYTVNPFDTGRLIEIDANESDLFTRIFFDKSKYMNGHHIFRYESVGYEQLIKLHSFEQQEIMHKKNQYYSKLIAEYFNVSVVSNRLMNGSKLQTKMDFCEESIRLQRYQ